MNNNQRDERDMTGDISHWGNNPEGEQLNQTKNAHSESPNSNGLIQKQGLSQKQRKSPIATPFTHKSAILDLVGDNVRNRYLTVCGFLLAYIYIVFTILQAVEEEPLMISEIQTKITLGDIYKISLKFQNQSTYPRLQLKASNLKETSRYPPLDITIFVQDFIYDQVSDASRDCSYSNRMLSAGTLDYFRLYEVCRVVLEGYQAPTNQNGEAVFKNFSLLRGPQGRYQFAYKTIDPFTSNKIINPGFVTYFETEVANMILRTYPDSYVDSIKLGEPLKIQPKLLLLDLKNQPVKGKRVIAFTWGEPQLSQKAFGFNYDPFKDKFGLLSGYLSELSGDDGIASFKNLTIEAFTGYSLYLYFSCENVVLKGFGFSQSEIYKQYGMMIYQFNFMQLNIVNIQVKIIGEYSRSVIEGQVFKKPITLQVINTTNNEPIEGLIVITTINNVKGQAFIKGYQGYGVGFRSKKIIKPITAKYSNSFMDPFAQNDPMISYRRTNSSGMIVLNELYFSVYGNQDSYRLEFWANGASTTSDWIKVNSTVKKVIILQQPESLLDSQLNDSLTIPFTVQVRNSQRGGVPGKQAVIQLIDPITKKVLDHKTELNAILQYSNDGYSNQDGILPLTVLITFTKKLQRSFQIKVFVDGISAITDKVTVKTKFLSSQLCGSIYFKNYPKSVTIGEKYNFDVKLLDQTGQPLANQYVLIYAGIDYNDNQLFPEEFIPKMKSDDFPYEMHLLPTLTNDQGEASYKNVIFLNGQSGQINLFALTASVDNLFLITNEFITMNNLNVTELFQKTYITQLVLAIAQKQYSNQTYYMVQIEIATQVESEIRNIIDNSFFSLYQLLQQSDDEGDSQNPFQEVTIQEVIMSMINMCSFCEARKLVINIKNPVSLVLIMSPSDPPKLKKGQENNVTLQILGDGLNPLASTELTPQIKLLRIPNTYFYRYSFGTIEDQVFKILSNGKTDSQGLLNITVEYLVNDVGLFMAVFEVFSSTSIAFPLFANHKCSKIVLQSQPKSNEGQPVAMGTFLKGFKVKALDSKGQELADLPIIFVIDTVSNDSNYKISYADIGAIHGDQTLVTMYQYRLNLTDKKGIAHFDSVTASGVGSENTCVRFRFQVGDNIFGGKDDFFPIVESGTSNLYCFYNNLEISIINTVDTQISPKGNFRNPPKVLVAIQKLSDCQKQLNGLFGGVLLTAQFYDLVDSQGESLINYQTDNRFLSNYYLANWYCSAIFGLFSQCDIDNITFDPSVSVGYQALTLYTFTNLNWKINKQASFQLSLSDSVSCNNKTLIDSQINEIISNLNIVNVGDIRDIILNVLSNSSIDLESSQYIIFEQTINLTISRVENIRDQFIKLLQNETEFWNSIANQSENQQIASIIDKANEVDPTFLLSVAPQFQQTGNLLTTAKLQVSSLFGSQSSKETPIITVNYNPSQIVIERQPPQIIYVQEVFTITVLVKSQDFPISDTTVSVGLSKPSTSTSGMSTIDIIQMITDLATGGVGISSMKSYMAIGSGAALDSDRISVRTDSQGRGTFNLKFTKGMNAFYQIGTECLGISGDNTIQFQIKNYIKQVRLQSDLKQVLGKDMVKTNRYTKFNDDIVLNITYEDDYIDDPTYPKNIEIYFFVYSNLEDLEQNFSTQANNLVDSGVNSSILNQQNESLSQIDYTNASNLDEGVKSIQQYVMNQMSGSMFSTSDEIMTSLKRVVMTGGQLFLAKKQAQLNINYKISSTKEVEISVDSITGQTTQLTIKGLRAHFQQLGVYQILVSVDGIQSQISGPITVMRMANIADSSVINPIIGVLILGIFMMIVYVNFFQTEETSLIQRFYTQLIFQNLEVYSDNHQRVLDEKQVEKKTQVTIGLQNKSKRKRLVLCTVLGLGCVLAGLVLTAVSQTQNAEQTGDYSFNIRSFFYYLSFVFLVPFCFDIIVSKFQQTKQGQLSFNSPFVDVKYYNAALYLKKLYNNELKRSGSIKEKFKQVFRPVFYHNEEFIFFPQKILTSAIVSLFSVAYIIYQLSLFIQTICSNLEKQTLVLQDGYSNFIATAINQIKSTLQFTLIYEEEFNKLYYPIVQLTDIILNLITAVKVAFIVSLILSFLTYSINQIMTLYDFRSRVLRLRRGIYEWDENPAKISLTTTAAFIGAHVSYCVIGMGLTLIIMTLGLTPLFYKYTWILAWELKFYVASIILSPIIQAVLKTIIFGKLIYRGDGVRNKFSLFNRALHSCVEIIFLYTSIAAGIIGAIARAIIMMGVIIFNSSVTYMSIYPIWISKLAISLDAVVHSYLATLRMHNLHNNPILLYFAASLVDQQKQNMKLSNISTKLKLTRNKFWVVYFLHQNQSLVKYRKVKQAKKVKEDEQVLPINI